jgi:hypothetical protein
MTSLNSVVKDRVCYRHGKLLAPMLDLVVERNLQLLTKNVRAGLYFQRYLHHGYKRRQLILATRLYPDHILDTTVVLTRLHFVGW